MIIIRALIPRMTWKRWTVLAILWKCLEVWANGGLPI
jgi:hypothetical protein